MVRPVFDIKVKYKGHISEKIIGHIFQIVMNFSYYMYTCLYLVIMPFKQH